MIDALNVYMTSAGIAICISTIPFTLVQVVLSRLSGLAARSSTKCHHVVSLLNAYKCIIQTIKYTCDDGAPLRRPMRREVDEGELTNVDLEET